MDVSVPDLDSMVLIYLAIVAPVAGPYSFVDVKNTIAWLPLCFFPRSPLFGLVTVELQGGCWADVAVVQNQGKKTFFLSLYPAGTVWAKSKGRYRHILVRRIANGKKSWPAQLTYRVYSRHIM